MSRQHDQNSGLSLCNVFVGGLGASGTQHELEDAFSRYGPVKSIRISTGFAFVEFEDPNYALDAVRALDGSILCGCRVTLEIANTSSSNRTPPNPERCYVCDERGHYAKDCYLQYNFDVPEVELDHPSENQSERVGDTSELSLDPETCEGSNWSSVMELMGIQSRTQSRKRNRHDDSNSSIESSNQESSNQHRRNTTQFQNRNEQPLRPQGNQSGRPPEEILIGSSPEQRDDRQGGSDWISVMELMDIQSRFQSQDDQESSNQHSRSATQFQNRTEQANFFPQQAWFYPQPNRSNRSLHRDQGDRYLQGNQGRRPPEEIWIDNSPQQRDDRQGPDVRSQQQHTTLSCSSISPKPLDGSITIKCAICLDTEDNQEMEYIPCGHGFHAKCCRDWLSVKSLCPVCRTAVAPHSGNVQDGNVDDMDVLFVDSL